MTLQRVKTIRDFSIKGKLVFLRLDLNVPLNKDLQIEDDSRIVATLPTIQYALSQGAKLVIASHLGRPSGKKKSELSLEPIAHRLAELLNQEVLFTDEAFGDGIELLVQGLKQGQILLLENLRFYPGEEENSPEFSRRLAKLCEIYINDAFGAAHRKHASTFGVPSLVSERGIGLLMEKEISHLQALLDRPEKPFFLILGGSKVSDKIKTIENLIRKVDGVLIGGAMAHAFTKAQGGEISSQIKPPSSPDVKAATLILEESKKRELPLFLPLDSLNGFDIGPKTIEQFSKVLKEAKTIFWNGPLGWFENPEYAAGTRLVAEMLLTLSANKIVGGGETVTAIRKANLANGFNHLSTGGGASLEFLEGKGLPGIEVLKLSQKELFHSRNAEKFEHDGSFDE